MDLSRISPLRKAMLVSMTGVFLGGTVLAILVFAFWQSGLEREATGTAIGGALGLLLSAAVFCTWVVALQRVGRGRDGRALWGAFGRGFALKALVLIAATLTARFALNGVSSAAVAVSFAGAALWINVLAVPFLHRQIGSPRGL